MALARTDEVDLLTALHDGVHEAPRFATLLARLRRRAGADQVWLVVGWGSGTADAMVRWYAGRDRDPPPAGPDPIPYHRLRPGRVYSTADMIDLDDRRRSGIRGDHAGPPDTAFARHVRVNEPGGHSAWLSTIRVAEDFSAADGALLSALAPHLAIALQTLGALDRARFREMVAQDALERAGIDWVVLDRDGRPAEAAASERGLFDGAGVMIEPGRPLPYAVRGDGTRRPDLLAVPLPNAPPVRAALTMLARTTPRATMRTAEALRRLYALSPSEARLATCLASGQSLAEAAGTLRLSTETARTYSKRLFDKTGTRGQADLVRLILTGVASLA